MGSLRFLVLDLYPSSEDSEFCAATADVFVRCSASHAVGTVRSWLASEGWVTNRVLRHRETTPEDWGTTSEEKVMADRAVRDGIPQVRMRRVHQARWSLVGTEAADPAPDLARFAAGVNKSGALWLQGSGGVEAITAPSGESAVPIWLADRPPLAWSTDVGQLAPVDLDSLLDHVLPEIDQQGDLVAIGAGDSLYLVHPGRLRRRLLMEPDPSCWPG